MEKIYDVIIIGGGPAGYSAALYSSRAGLDTLVIERMMVGGQMALTDIIDNYPGFDQGIDGFTLGQQMRENAERFGAESRFAEVKSLSLVGDVKSAITTDGEFLAKTVVVATGAVRFEHTSMEYAPIEFPAVPDFTVTAALKAAGEALGYRTHVGVVQCKDSFYGQHSPHRMPVSYELEQKWDAWIKAGTLASEMETASLFTVASTLRLKAAAVLLVIWNQEKERKGLAQETSFDVDKQIFVAIRAISNIIKGR